MALDSRLAAVTTLALLALAAPAAAGPPGTWTKVHDAESTTPEIGLARSSNGLLNVLWPSPNNAVVNTQISANAQNLIGPHTVFVYTSDGGGVSNSMALLPAPDGGLRAFFSGLYPDNPHDVGLSTATSADGVSWAVQPTLASDSRTGMRSSVYVAAGIGGTVMNDGVPVSIWGDSAPGEAGYHLGTSDQTDDFHFGGNSATVARPNAATDSATGQVVIGWTDLDAGRTLTQSIAPAGGRVSAPGGLAPDAGERLAMTGRDGPGIFVAYPRGTNVFDAKMAVWRFGAGSAMVLSPKDARFPGVARGTDGRIWAFWALQRLNYELFAARSNEAATQFGARVKINLPSRTTSLWSLEGEGTAPGGLLDLVALFTRGGAEANYHQRIRPGITLKADNSEEGVVVFTVEDAGDPVEGATVKFAGKSKKTNGKGRTTIAAEGGRQTARASADGYTKAKKRVRVKPVEPPK